MELLLQRTGDLKSGKNWTGWAGRCGI